MRSISRARLVSAVAVLAVASMTACSQNRSAAATPPVKETKARPSQHAEAVGPAHLDPDRPVASIKGETITARQLDEQVRGAVDEATRDYAQRVYDVRKEGLEEMVLDRILGMEATERGIPGEELIQAEVMQKVQPPTDEELQAFYDKYVKDRNMGTLEDLAPRIRAQLMQERVGEVSQKFVEELRAKYEVTVSLPLPEVPRVEVAATGPSKGPKDAPVTIVEFSDFECPYCARGADTVDRVVEKYGDKVRVVFRQFPLSFHKKAPKAGEASLCAEDQGKFWEMHDRLFAHQDKLEVADLKAHAKAIGLDAGRFAKCLDGGAKAAQVQADLSDGAQVGINGTPAFFVNGRLLSGAQPFEAFRNVIDAELAN